MSPVRTVEQNCGSASRRSSSRTAAGSTGCPLYAGIALLVCAAIVVVRVVFLHV